jgi:hypothetical protein
VISGAAEPVGRLPMSLVYLEAPDDGPARPVRILAAFAHFVLRAGASRPSSIDRTGPACPLMTAGGLSSAEGEEEYEGQ